jgi:hypothetical protein
MRNVASRLHRGAVALALALPALVGFATPLANWSRRDLRSSFLGWLLILGLLLVVLAVMFVIAFFQKIASVWRDRRVVHAIRRVREVAIADAVDGQLVRVAGRVRAGRASITSPGGVSCVAFNDASGGEPDDAADFFVEDASGRARVAVGAGVTLHLVPDDDQEICLRADQDVMVVGVARWQDAPDERADYRQPAVGRALVLSAPDGGRVLVGDDFR